ncbi:MAG: TrmH family RNA methyltransferase [Roseburia sp.]
MITSTGNQQMKNLMLLQKKAKARNEQGVFVVEGRKMFQEVPKEWLRRVYVAESFRDEHGELLSDCDCEIVSDAVFKSVSDTQTPQGILCLVQMPHYELSRLLAGERTSLLVLESIQDPGNLGTMLRTGEGAGITGVIMNRTTVDLFNPKTIRSTMGSIYRVPFYISENLPDTIEQLKQQGVSVYAAHLKGKIAYDEPDYRKASAFLIGNEGNGLSDELAELADCYIRIPMEGQVESLNAAVSASLLMYEAHRQRRQ